jgi:hypothetical protein
VTRGIRYAINELMRAQEWAVYVHHSKAQPALAADDDSDSDHSPKGYMSPMKRSPSRYVAAPPPLLPPACVLLPLLADHCIRGGPLVSRDASSAKNSPHHTPVRSNGV